MADKPVISLKELQKLTAAGAEVEIDRKPREVVGITDLVEAIKQLTDQERARIRADISRNQANLEILATLQAMVRKQGEKTASPTDLGPLVDVLREISEQRVEPPGDPLSYDFVVTARDGNGFAHSIRATPVSGVTKH